MKKILVKALLIILLIAVFVGIDIGICYLIGMALHQPWYVIFAIVVLGQLILGGVKNRK